MTPRKILALWDKHCLFKGWKEPETKQTAAGAFHDTGKAEYAEQVPWL